MKVLLRKKSGSVIENMLVFLIGTIITTAFLVIVFGAFSSISNKWQMRQVSREYMLLMETEGYLNATDKAAMITELESFGLKNITITGTTTSQVSYGETIYLKISGTYNENVLAFAGGISKVADHSVTITINRQSTAKQ